MKAEELIKSSNQDQDEVKPLEDDKLEMSHQEQKELQVKIATTAPIKSLAVF